MKKIAFVLSLFLVLLIGYSTISVHATEPTTDVPSTEVTGPTDVIKSFSITTTTHDFDYVDFSSNYSLYTWWVWNGEYYVIASDGIKYETLNVEINGNNVPFYTGSNTAAVFITDKKTTGVYIDFYIRNDGTISGSEEFIELYKDPLGCIYITSDDVDLNEHFGLGDVIAPTFINSAEQIAVSKNVKLNIATIKQHINYEDNLDNTENIEILTIENTYDNNEEIPGTYSIVFEAKDLVGNKKQHTVTVTVVEALYDLYIVDNQNIYITADNPIVLTNIKTFLKDFNLVTTEDEFTINILSGDYFENSSSVGDYVTEIEVIYSDTTTDTLSLNIFVVNDLIINSIQDSLTSIQKVISATLGTSIIAITLIFFLRKKTKRNRRRR